MSLNISASGLSAALDRQRVTSNNIANVNTQGFRAGIASTTEAPAGGALPGPTRHSEAAAVLQFTGNPQDVAQGVEGFIEGSNVDLATEQVNSLLNTRTVQANADAFRVQSDVIGELLDIVG